MAAGRPSDYDPEIASEVCLRISIGSLGLRAVCDSDPRFPDPATFYRWMLSHAELREIYTRAKNEQLQILADEIQQIADELQLGEIVTLKGNDREVKIADMLEHRKLRIESRKWLLAKLAPKKYGEKLQAEHSGEIAVQISGMKAVRAELYGDDEHAR